MKKKLLAAALGAFVGLGMYAAPTDAHGVFYANRLDQKALVLGEGPLDNAYDPACVQRIDAYDVNFEPTTVERVDAGNHVTIVPGDDLGVTATFFDYGYFAKTTDGQVIPTRDYASVENLKAVTYARKYNVHYWNAAVKPGGLYNVPIQIVPAVNPLTLRRGDALRLRIYKDGQPYANAPVIADVLGDLHDGNERGCERLHHRACGEQRPQRHRRRSRLPHGRSDRDGEDLQLAFVHHSGRVRAASIRKPICA